MNQTRRAGFAKLTQRGFRMEEVTGMAQRRLLTARILLSYKSENCRRSSTALLLSVVICSLSAGFFLPVIAVTEQEEEKTYLQTLKFVKAALEYPSVEANSHGDFERALVLRKRAVDELTAVPADAKSVQQALYNDLYTNLSAQVEILKSLGRLDEAIEAYTKAEDLHDKHFGHHSDRRMAIGSIYADGGMFDKALEKYEDVAKSDKVMERYGAHVALSQLYLKQNKPALAEREVSDLLVDPQVKESSWLLRGCREWLRNFYVRERRPADEQKMVALLEDKHCPKCGSDKNVIRIVYGLQSVGIVDATKDEVYHGGCCVSMESPGWLCKADQCRF